VELSDSLIRKEQRGSEFKEYSPVLLAAAFAKVLSTREGYGPLCYCNYVGCWFSAYLCKDFVVALCNHTSEVWYDSWLAFRMVRFKVLQNFYASCGESVQPLQS
jgi:hypothetical protein